jgi:hypothetical protein
LERLAGQKNQPLAEKVAVVVQLPVFAVNESQHVEQIVAFEE